MILWYFSTPTSIPVSRNSPEASRLILMARLIKGESLLRFESIPAQLLAVAVEVASHLAQRVAAELLAHGRSDDERDHRLAYDARGRDRRDVRALERRGLFLLRVYVN